MAVMNDSAILRAIQDKLIFIDPLDANDIQPASIDLRLHKIIEQPVGNGVIDISAISKEELKTLFVPVDITEGFELKPGSYVVGYSHERIKFTSQIAGRIFNRNSLVKIGLNANLSSFINPGFHGRKVIVVQNFGHHPIILKPEMRICQLEIEYLDSAPMRSYEERHDVTKLKDFLPRRDRPNIDTSLSEYLDEQIKAAARR